jgi:hypothetical protein
VASRRSSAAVARPAVGDMRSAEDIHYRDVYSPWDMLWVVPRAFPPQVDPRAAVVVLSSGAVSACDGDRTTKSVGR